MLHCESRDPQKSGMWLAPLRLDNEERCMRASIGGDFGIWARAALLCALAPVLAGCETIAITALGVGASAGVSHTASSIGYRTFTAPAPRVRVASLAALERMGIRVEKVDRLESSELIIARSADRSIEIELEAMSRNTTQMRAAAKRNAFVYDAATAKEIIEQTAVSLGQAPRRAQKPAPTLASGANGAPKLAPASY